MRRRALYAVLIAAALAGPPVAAAPADADTEAWFAEAQDLRKACRSLEPAALADPEGPREERQLAYAVLMMASELKEELKADLAAHAGQPGGAHAWVACLARSRLVQMGETPGPVPH